ncbi:transglutaminase domain-containing protein [Cesiribacter sp. SM1]|uniref:DUF3857 domain-containing protein n=1 Tax=Cesiribacter sp. SM1 TaxID=2861196 RepID=UPI001CD48BA0|nr:transglutaminase domain-containing protein [Cesiribacter sp. SM1]
MKRKLTILLLLLFAGVTFSLKASSPKPVSPEQLLASYQGKYPGEPGIYLEQRTEVHITQVNGEVQVSTRYFYDLLHLTDQSNHFAREVLHANSFRTLSNIDAYSLVANKSKYKKVPVEQFEEKDNVVGAGFVFYDDTKQTRFVFPGARPGTRNVLQYEEQFKEPRFLSPWYPSTALPVEKAELKIIVDPAVQIKFREFNTQTLGLGFTETKENNNKVYRWSAANIAGMRRIDDNAPAAPHFMPHIVYWVEKVNAQTPKLFLSNPKDLYTFYTSFIKDLKPEGDSYLQATVDSLVQNAPTEEEKVRRILYWVQDHVKYIAFEDGMRGFVPNSAGLVYKNRYGDCKDMSSITWSMLRMAGIQNTHLAWIGTRRLPYRYAEVPTPLVDNHMIAVYKSKEGYIFLDATSQHTQFGLPSSMIQGKEALVSLGPEQFEVVPVPTMPATVNLHQDSLYLHFDQNSLRGSGSLSMQGYPKTFATYSLEGTNKLEEKEKIKKVLTKGHNKFFVEDYTISNLYDRDLPLQISYKCAIDDYHRQIGKELYVNLHLERDYENDRIDLEKRKLERENEFCFDDRQVVVLEVPADYKVQYLPANQEFSHPLFGFKFSYRTEGNKVILDKQLRINHLLLKKEDFPKWNEMVAQLQEAYREVVILDK